MTTLSRRSFIRTASVVPAAAGLGLTGCASVKGASSDWDETYDVVVVGSGFAGLAAALAQDFTKSRTTRLSRCQERLVPFLAIHAQESEPP